MTAPPFFASPTTGAILDGAAPAETAMTAPLTVTRPAVSAITLSLLIRRLPRWGVVPGGAFRIDRPLKRTANMGEVLQEVVRSSMPRSAQQFADGLRP